VIDKDFLNGLLVIFNAVVLSLKVREETEVFEGVENDWLFKENCGTFKNLSFFKRVKQFKPFLSKKQLKKNHFSYQQMN